MDPNTVTKIQALWRGFCSRKGKTMPCGACGYPMTLDGTRYHYYPPCSWCQQAVRNDVQYDDEPFIPCCICGNNCADGDYESWRFCTRRCMVEAGRDRF